jgi:2-methylcitrate dehydratase
LLTRIDIRPNARLTAGYPRTTPVRVEVLMRNGQSVSREQQDFEGAPRRPLTWERTVETFHWLAQEYAEDGLRDAIIDAVESLGDEPVSQLTGC